MSSYVRITINGKFCGPISVGSIAIIQLLREHAGHTLTEAKEIVDRCVFEGETVDVLMPSPKAAHMLIQSLKLLPANPVVIASIL